MNCGTTTHEPLNFEGLNARLKLFIEFLLGTSLAKVAQCQQQSRSLHGNCVRNSFTPGLARATGETVSKWNPTQCWFNDNCTHDPNQRPFVSS
eukprot:2335790-Amphidinium_carterae.1